MKPTSTVIQRFPVHDALATCVLAACALAASAACSFGAAAQAPTQGTDTQTPFPIDRGGVPGAPVTYKGLPLGLHPAGQPDVAPVDGAIGLVCIGMSNASQECADFAQRFQAGEYPGAEPAVRVVNCAVGSHAIERWNDPAYDGVLWDACVRAKVPAAGLRPEQVRVVWHKAASQYTTDASGNVLPPYPDPGSDYFRFYASLAAFARRLADKLPSVQAVYTSSRSYGGFATNRGRGEPLSFEEGLALNAWLADGESGRSPAAPWYGWGPYLWAPDCASGVTNAGGVCYERDDYRDDGVHPSPSGREKVSRLLDRRLREHAWYAPPRAWLPLAVRP